MTSKPCEQSSWKSWKYYIWKHHAKHNSCVNTFLNIGYLWNPLGIAPSGLLLVRLVLSKSSLSHTHATMTFLVRMCDLASQHKWNAWSNVWNTDKVKKKCSTCKAKGTILSIICPWKWMITGKWKGWAQRPDKAEQRCWEFIHVTKTQLQENVPDSDSFLFSSE